MDPHQRRILVVAVLASGLAFLDLSSVHVMLPILQEDFHVPLGPVQWVAEAFILTLAALMLVGGSLGDRFGRRRVLVIGLGIFAAASVGAALAPGVWWLVAARAVQGVGAALVVPASLALITNAFPKDERAGAFGVWAAMTGLTAAGGPALAGFLAENLSWRWFFALVVPFALGVIWAARRIDEEREDDAPLDMGGAALALAALGAIAFGLIRANRQPWSDWTVWGPLGAGAVLFALFLTYEARRRRPMMPLGLFRDPAFAGVNAATLLLYAALGGMFFFIPFHLIQVQGWSATWAGAATAPAALVMMLLSRPFGRFADRVGPRWPMVGGSVLWAVGIGLLIVPGTDATYWTTFLPAFIVLGIGMSLLVPPLTATVMTHVPREDRGTASGINNTIARVAGLLAIALYGAVAVAVFTASLPVDVADALGPDAARLAAAEAPSGYEEEVIHDAFLRAFRVVMGIGVAMSLLAAAILARTAPRGNIE